MADEQDVLRDHSFDGIQEYDNKLPLWWQVIFYVSIVWGGLYFAWYHIAGAEVGVEAYETAREERLRDEALAAAGLPSEEELRAFSHDATRVASGKELFFGRGNCATCHGENGLGLVGPNLRDDLWIYGSDMSVLVETLRDGRNNNTMPANKGILTTDQMIDLAAYIADWNRTAKQDGGVTMGARESKQPINW